MCGAYALNQIEKLKDRFGIGVDPEDYGLLPRYNIRPSQQAPVVVHDGNNELRFMRWGLIPFWAKDPSVGYKMINARAETVDTLNSYKRPFRSQRCVIPMNGFYEWLKTAHGKTPYYFTATDEDILGVAGLYDTWKDPGGNTISSYTLITTTPNELVAKVHDRMPAILLKENEEAWLDPSNDDTLFLKEMLSPYPAELMQSFPVSSLVNSPKNDTPAIFTHAPEEAQ